MDYYSELATANECNEILRRIADLESAMRSGPRLCAHVVMFNTAALKSMRDVYVDLVQNCNNNMR